MLEQAAKKVFAGYISGKISACWDCAVQIGKNIPTPFQYDGTMDRTPPFTPRGGLL